MTNHVSLAAKMLLVLLTVLTIYLIFFDFKWGFIVSFLCGLFFDIYFVGVLGTTSLKLVLLTFVINIYKRKFNTGHFFFSFFFCLLVILIVRVEQTGLNLNLFKNLREIMAALFLTVPTFMILSKIKNARL